MEHFIQDFQFIAIAILIGAAAIFAIIWLFECSPIAQWFMDSEGIVVSFITIPAFLFGLAFSTLSSSIWESHTTANLSLINESAAIRTLESISLTLPQHDGVKLREASKNYVEAVLSKEWPAMKLGDSSKQNIASSEFEDLNVTVNEIATQANQRLSTENRLIGALDTIRHERLLRLSLAYDSTNFARWPSVFVFSFLLLLTVGLLQLKRPRAMRIAVSMGALCIGSTMLFLYLNLSPYHGMNSIEPTLLVDTLSSLNTPLINKH